MSFPEQAETTYRLTKKELTDIVEEAVSSALRHAGDRRIKIDMTDVFTQMQRPPTNLAIRHFLSWEHRFHEMMMERSRRAARETYDFIESDMPNAVYTVDQFAVLESKSAEILNHGGSVLDLGVYKGSSTRRLATMFPNKMIHGFDSFEGLPEDWAHVLKGQFGEIKGKLPEMPDNVTLYKGWFDETLPTWAHNNRDSHISLLRVDCDIYSSTKTIFDVVGHMLTKGSWICFDELIGYYGWKFHEHKAFMEFIDKTGFGYEYKAYGLTYTIAVLV